MSRYYRRRGEGWSKKVDITWLSMMEAATARIRSVAEREKLEPIINEVEKLELALANAQGRLSDIDLKKHAMPAKVLRKDKSEEIEQESNTKS